MRPSREAIHHRVHMLMLAVVLVFAGCGKEEPPEPTMPQTLEPVIEEPPRPTCDDRSVDELSFIRNREGLRRAATVDVELEGASSAGLSDPLYLGVRLQDRFAIWATDEDVVKGGSGSIVPLGPDALSIETEGVKVISADEIRPPADDVAYDTLLGCLGAPRY